MCQSKPHRKFCSYLTRNLRYGRSHIEKVTCQLHGFEKKSLPSRDDRARILKWNNEFWETASTSVMWIGLPRKLKPGSPVNENAGKFDKLILFASIFDENGKRIWFGLPSYMETEKEQFSDTWFLIMKSRKMKDPPSNKETHSFWLAEIMAEPVRQVRELYFC